MTIREKREQIIKDYNAYINNINSVDSISKENYLSALADIKSWRMDELTKLEYECSFLGHLNLETIHRNDNINSSYFICDNCKGLVEL